VYVTDEDLEAAEGEGYRTLDIEDFVAYDEIDPIYFEQTYYLGPADGAERVYALLLRAMEQSGLCGIGTYVMRDKQHLGCLRVREGVIQLEKMYFAERSARPTSSRSVRRRSGSASSRWRPS
jgi:DNA end-binding protein Ku